MCCNFFPERGREVQRVCEGNEEGVGAVGQPERQDRG